MRPSTKALDIEFNTECSIGGFANSASCEVIYSDENEVTYKITVLGGLKTNSILEDKNKFDYTYLEEGCLVLSEGKVFAYTKEDELFYTLALPEVKEGYTLRLFRLGKRLNNIGLVTCSPKVEPKSKKILAKDVKFGWLPLCSEVLDGNKYGATPEPLVCHREDSHAGPHQHFSEYKHAEWSNGGSVIKPETMFGVEVECHLCGTWHLISSNEAETSECFTCSFWLRQKKQPNGFIIQGRHYFPGTGGFGGKEFKLKLHNGSTWTGQLSTQGTVPEHLRKLFPDNAVFIR